MYNNMSSYCPPKPPIPIISNSQEHIPEFLSPLFAAVHAPAAVTEVNTKEDPHKPRLLQSPRNPHHHDRVRKARQPPADNRNRPLRL